METAEKSISIPIFGSNKNNYNNWKAAFMACIDKAPAAAKYKLLQLPHSAAAYQIAKERFGGQWWQMTIYLEELKNLRPVRFVDSRDLEQFADILDITTLTWKKMETGELGDGSLYLGLQKKLPEIMLTQYQRWIYEKRRQQYVETLRVR